MTKKHSLTFGADKIVGVKGKDLFLGALDNGNATLTSADKLNGGAGIDTVRADLFGGSVAASLKNIEIGRFTNSAVTAASLDLAKATAMSKVIIEDLVGTMAVTNAGHVSSITLATVDLVTVIVNGIDTKATKTVKVNFDNNKDATLSLVTEGLKQIRNLDLTLEGSNAAFLGNVDARSVTVHSHGTASNNLLLSPAGAHDIQHLAITGEGTLFVDDSSAFQDLRTFDASKATGNVNARIGGDHLTSILGSAGNDTLRLVTTAGSTAGKTAVNLGKGNDSVELNFDFNADRQSYDGGKGIDQLHLMGAAAKLNTVVKNFEQINVTAASGEYNVNGLNIQNFYFESTTNATSLTHLANDATVVVTHDIANFLSISLASQPVGDASLQLSLYNGIQLGAASVGFSLANADHLEIHVFNGDAAIFFAGVGASTRMVDLTITGGDDLALSTTNGANSFISAITVEGSGALDMSGFASSALNATGVTVTGGSGDDVLVGGAGVDLIVTGGGDNTVLGSTGADVVRLKLGSGADTLVFTEQAQSGFGIPGDKVQNFEAFDVIDISDIMANVTFIGNFGTTIDGMAALSTAHASAYFNTASHVLFIDLDHNKEMNGGTDMEITLEGVAVFNAYQLVS